MQALSQLSYTPNRSTIDNNFLSSGKPQIIEYFLRGLQPFDHIFFAHQLEYGIK